MAKKTAQQETLIGFELNPEIKNLGIKSVQLGAGVVKADVVATTQANDITMLTPERWAEAYAGALVKLCGGNLFLIQKTVDKAYEEDQAERRAREADEEIGYGRTNRNRTVIDFPSVKENLSLVSDLLSDLGVTGVTPTIMEAWSPFDIVKVKAWVQDYIQARNERKDLPVMPDILVKHQEWLNARSPETKAK